MNSAPSRIAGHADAASAATATAMVSRRARSTSRITGR